MTQFWSCKLKRPDTLKSHRTLETAIKKAGDHGFVYDQSKEIVYQIHKMASGELKPFDVIQQSEYCNTGDFDMRVVMRQIYPLA